MSERYSRLFALPEDLYCVGSPVVIAAGALLKDNQTGKVIGQLKLRNISQKAIKAVKVKLHLFDTAGNPIGESVAHTYLDLNARRNEEFGQKSPVTVAESQTRSYQASVTEVVFEDQSVWTANEGTWEPLAKPVALSITDPELLKQYQMHYGSGAKYEAKAEKDLWNCTCGALNHEGENCHICGHSLFELQTVDMEKLTAEKDARLAEIARKAAEEQAAAEAQKKKTTKILAVVIPAVCAVIAIILLATKVIIPNGKYNDAVALMDAGNYEEAITAFEAIEGYKDSVQMIEACEQGIIDREYNNAVALMEAGKYEEAVSAFDTLGDFRNSAEMAEQAEIAANYIAAENLLAEGKTAEAAMAFAKIVGYNDARERSNALWAEIAVRETIGATTDCTIALRSDGTVVAVGRDWCGVYDVGNWTDIVAISAGDDHIVGLRSNGTVLAVGSNDNGECNVDDWTNIVAVSAGDDHTVGLRNDGTVVAVGENDFRQCNVGDWYNIVAVSAGYNHTVGLRSDGTVVAVGGIYSEAKTDSVAASCDVEGWSDIIAISAGTKYSVGLRNDGTVVAVGDILSGEEKEYYNVSGWTDIAAVSAGDDHTVGLRNDGTVVAVGSNVWDRCAVDNWTDIVAICNGDWYTMGLRNDGTVVIVGNNYYNDGQWNDVCNWTNIKLPN